MPGLLGVCEGRCVDDALALCIVCHYTVSLPVSLHCVLHQVVEDGYEFFAKRQLVTLFSAPNYCGEFDNAGAMMSVDETLMCSFQVRVPNVPTLNRLTSLLLCRS